VLPVVEALLDPALPWPLPWVPSCGFEGAVAAGEVTVAGVLAGGMTTTGAGAGAGVTGAVANGGVAPDGGAAAGFCGIAGPTRTTAAERFVSARRFSRLALWIHSEPADVWTGAAGLMSGERTDRVIARLGGVTRVAAGADAAALASALTTRGAAVGVGVAVAARVSVGLEEIGGSTRSLVATSVPAVPTPATRAPMLTLTRPLLIAVENTAPPSPAAAPPPAVTPSTASLSATVGTTGSSTARCRR
jgi:hypothetical protein